MTPDAELRDLTAANEVYLALVQQVLGASVPLAPEILHPETHPDWIEHSVAALKSWLNLLDMAITPALMRESLKNCKKSDGLEALLRYYVLRASTSDRERDKADLLVTELFRNEAGNQPASRLGADYDVCQDRSLAFEKRVRALLEGIESPAFPDEHVQLLRQFAGFYDELANFSSFEQLTDSVLIERVRAVKQSFAGSFYHPAVLATIAVYNVSFREIFDDLFHRATLDLKQFAASIQKNGPKWEVPADDQMDVAQFQDEHLAHLLKREYDQAQNQFKKISRFKKAVASHRKSEATVKAQRAATVESSGHGPSVEIQSPSHATANEERTTLLRVASENALQESKVVNVRDSIRAFVKVADPNKANIVPVPVGNVVLSQAELDAFRADYDLEKSFRGEYVSNLMHMVALHTRVREEQHSYRSKRRSTYLWKPHADSLQYLLGATQRAAEQAGRLLKLAQQRGLKDKVTALKSTCEKVQVQAVAIAQELQS